MDMYRMAGKNGTLCSMACSFRSIDHIGTKSISINSFLTLQTKNSIWKIKWRHLTLTNACRFLAYDHALQCTEQTTKNTELNLCF